MMQVKASQHLTKLLRLPSVLPKSKRPVAATLGMFDGVHLGHQALLAEVTKRAGLRGTSLAISFYPHPDLVVGSGSAISYLTSTRQKLHLLSNFGINFLYLMHFTPEFARIEAAHFLKTILMERLKVDHLVIGPDAHVGAGRKGTPEFIVQTYRELGGSAEIMPFIDQAGARISSGVIRHAISDGDVEMAEKLLGRCYSLEARVVRGDGRGKALGFPTANLMPTRQSLPKVGIYSCKAWVDGQHYLAATSVGLRPTFGGKQCVVEVHLLDYKGGDFYGKRIEVEFAKRLRDEKKFGSVEELKSAMQDDVNRVRHS